VTPPLREAYDAMLARHGHLHWWPAESPFEVCVGAILTQNTAWANVERAIARLKQAGVMTPAAMSALPEAELADLIRPAGYYNVKARRLRCFLRTLAEECQGRLSRLFAGSVTEARERLLGIPGVGPETADSMLLYAGGHLSFVVDAYTARIFGRHGWSPPGADYDRLQGICVNGLALRPNDDPLDLWQDFHAQLVIVGKDYCRPRAPRCETCPLKAFLPASGCAQGSFQR
jgi:endonuclease-3 related protein